MIVPVNALSEWEDLIQTLQADPDYSEPMLATPEQVECNLRDALRKPDKRLMGVLGDAGERRGLFCFLVLEQDRYLEMLVGLSRDPGAWAELADCLRADYPGWEAGIVFNPRNPLALAMLEREGAEIYPEQLRMVWDGTLPETELFGVELLSEPRKAAYIALHQRDCYWTGERVAEAPQFRVLLALEEDVVVGYLDVTDDGEENEIFDLYVRPESRRRGHGRRLLAKALELNRPKGMMLMVDADNEPALGLYASMGFREHRGWGSQDAVWRIPER